MKQLNSIKYLACCFFLTFTALCCIYTGVNLLGEHQTLRLIIYGLAGLFLSILAVIVFRWSYILLKTSHIKSVRFAKKSCSTQISKAVLSAIRCSQKNLNVPPILKKLILYRKPWIIICGPANSGKSAFLDNSEVVLTTPENDIKSSMRFLCSDVAVWIDTSSEFIQPEGNRSIHELCFSLMKHRRKKPLNAVVVVLDVLQILKMDTGETRKIANDLSHTFKTLMNKTGVVFTVYFVFSKSDKLDGFQEYFSEQITTERKRSLGAVFEHSSQLPSELFTSNFSYLSNSVNQLRTDKILNSKNSIIREMICNFTFQFSSCRDKIELLLDEIFCSRGEDANPAFGGYFFTGNIHSSTTNESKQKELAIFSHMLVKETIPNGSKNSFYSRSRLRTESLRQISFLLLFFSGLLFSSVLIVSSGFDQIAQLKSQSIKLHNIASSTSTASLYNDYQRMDFFRTLAIDNNRTGSGIHFNNMFFSSKQINEEVNRVYLYYARKLVVEPAVRFLKYEIQKKPTDAYEPLREYLFLCGKANRASNDSFMYAENIKKAVLNTLNVSNEIYDSLESLLSRNVGTSLSLMTKLNINLIEEDLNFVAQTRKKLTSAPDAEMIYQNCMKNLCSTSPYITLAELLPESQFLSSSAVISSVYTKTGWSQTVKQALAQAAENPFRSDWVMGSQEIRHGLDKDDLYSRLVNLYGDDFTKQWLAFIRVVEYRKEENGELLSVQLKKYSSVNSELVSLLLAVLSNTRKNIFGGIPKSEQMTATLNSKIAANVIAKVTRDDPFIHIDSVFNPLRVFFEQDIEYYRLHITEIADEVLNVEEGNGEEIVTIYNSGKDDPVRRATKGTRKILDKMPSEMSAALENILIQPIQNADRVVYRSLADYLNEKWKITIFLPFEQKLSGRFPFTPGSSSEVSLSDFEDFFRPKTGVFWGFYDRALSKHIVKTAKGWESSPAVGGVILGLDKGTESCFSAAESIAQSFFRPDGSRKSVDISVVPLRGNKTDAKLIYGTHTFELAEGKATCLQWHGEYSLSAALLLGAGENSFREMRFEGSWGLIKLIDCAKLVQTGEHAYDATWQINMQGMYLLQYKARISSNCGNPVKLIEQFQCPERILSVIPSSGYVLSSP